MNLGLILATIYAVGAVITMIVYDVIVAMKNKKEKVDDTFWDCLQDSAVSLNYGLCWPIYLPHFLCELITQLKY